MNNVYTKFEKKLTAFCYEFAKEIEQEINSCEFDHEHGSTRAAVINSCLADIVPSLSNFPYAQAVLNTAKSKAKEKFEHLEEVYK